MWCKYKTCTKTNEFFLLCWWRVSVWLKWGMRKSFQRDLTSSHLHHVHNRARNEHCHHPVCNRQQQRMGHINHVLTACRSYKVWHDDRAYQSVHTFVLTSSSSLLFTWFPQIISPSPFSHAFSYKFLSCY